ncbi:MAG: hypothetical protein RR847_00710 [Bacilli bacterium]
MENKKRRTLTNFNINNKGSDFKGRLKWFLDFDRIVLVKKKSKAVPIFSSRIEEINFTNQGIDNMNFFKKSVVVKENDVDIVTAKPVKIVKKSSLTKVHDDIKHKITTLDMEIAIKNKIDNFILKNKKKLSLLKEQLDNINDGISNIFLKDEIDLKKQKIKDIKKKANVLRLECLLVYNNSDFKNFDILNDEKLDKMITHFTSDVAQDEITVLASSCRDDIDYVDNLLVTLDKTAQINFLIALQDNDITSRDDDFKKYKGEVATVSNKNNEIINILSKENKKMADIMEQLNTFENHKDNLSLIDLKQISNNYIKYLFSVSHFQALLHLLTLNIFGDKQNELQNEIFKRRRLINKTYDNYADMLGDGINQLKYLSTNIKHCLYDLRSLCNTFDNKFYKYKHLIPEYDIIYNKLDQLKGILNKKSEEIINVNEVLIYKKQKAIAKKI